MSSRVRIPEKAKVVAASDSSQALFVADSGKLCIELAEGFFITFDGVPQLREWLGERGLAVADLEREQLEEQVRKGRRMAIERANRSGGISKNGLEKIDITDDGSKKADWELAG